MTITRDAALFALMLLAACADDPFRDGDSEATNAAVARIANDTEEGSGREAQSSAQAADQATGEAVRAATARAPLPSSN